LICAKSKTGAADLDAEGAISARELY